MIKVELKVGRDVIYVDKDDIILDNGACVQILTKRKFSGWHDYPMRMSKKLFKELLKYHYITFLNESIGARLKYYKFDIDEWYVLVTFQRR